MDQGSEDGNPVEAEGVSQRFNRLRQAYPSEGAVLLARARGAFNALDEAEQLAALRAAPVYAAFCRKGRSPRIPKDLHNWLSLRMFRDFAPAEAASPMMPGGRAANRVFVRRETDQGRAWEAWRRAREGRGYPWSTGPAGDGWYFEAEWPPGGPRRAPDQASG